MNLKKLHNDIHEGALQLMAEHRVQLFARAKSICGNDIDADELVIRTIDQAIRRIDSYSGEGDILSWMMSILVNLHNNDHRKPVVRGTTAVEAEELERYAGADWSTDEQLLKNSDSEAIRAAIAGLDPKYNQVLMMRYYDEFSLKQIAAVLQLPLGTVSRRMQIAHRIISGKLAAEFSKVKPKFALLGAFLLAGSLFGAAAWGIAEAVSAVRSLGSEVALESEGTLGSLESEGSLGAAADPVDPNPDPIVPKDSTETVPSPLSATGAATLSTTENTNTEKEETMNLKTITKTTAKLAVGAALTAGFAANAAFGSNVPDGCALLEYAQGNGSAYLITDYTPDPSQDTIVVDVDLVAGQGSQTIFCARNPSTGENTWSLLRQADGTLRYDFGSASSGNRYVSPVVSLGRHRITADQNGLSVDGKAVSLYDFKTEKFTPGGPLWLFAMPWEGSTNYSSMKLRSLAILRGGEVVKFYLPIKDGQGHATVCDILGKSLVTQVGTGFLVAGPETETWASSVLSKEPTRFVRYAGFGNVAPLKAKVVDAITGEDLADGVDYSLSCVGATQVGYAQLTVKGMGRYYGCGAMEKLPVLAKLPRGYTQVESLDSTGNEYVDLEFHPTGKTDFFIDFDLLSSQKDGEGYPTPFGARASDAAGYKLTEDKVMTDWTLTYGSSQIWVSKSGFGAHTFESAPTRGRYAIDGNEFSMTISPSLSVDANAYLFSFNELKGQPSGVTANAVHLAKMKLFAFALWDDGVLKRDLVPCKTDQGVYGLYDLVSKRFFGNASKAGAFTGGPAMPNLPCQGTMILIY